MTTETLKIKIRKEIAWAVANWGKNLNWKKTLFFRKGYVKVALEDFEKLKELIDEVLK